VKGTWVQLFVLGFDREAFSPQKFGLRKCTLGFFKASLNLT
jgi:hypothetical protein